MQQDPPGSSDPGALSPPAQHRGLTSGRQPPGNRGLPVPTAAGGSATAGGVAAAADPAWHWASSPEAHPRQWRSPERGHLPRRWTELPEQFAAAARNWLPSDARPAVPGPGQLTPASNAERAQHAPRALHTGDGDGAAASGTAGGAAAADWRSQEAVMQQLWPWPRFSHPGQLTPPSPTVAAAAADLPDPLSDLLSDPLSDPLSEAAAAISLRSAASPPTPSGRSPGRWMRPAPTQPPAALEPGQVRPTAARSAAIAILAAASPPGGLAARSPTGWLRSGPPADPRLGHSQIQWQAVPRAASAPVAVPMPVPEGRPQDQWLHTGSGNPSQVGLGAP